MSQLAGKVTAMGHPTAKTLAILALAVVGCSTPPEDPLSDEAIEDVISDEGDADGDQWSGTYALALSQTTCDCPTIAGVINLCEQIATGNQVEVDVVQTGGYVQVAIEGYQLGGPVDQTGSFAAAGLFDLTTVVSNGDLTVRLDGQFMKGSSDTANLEGVLVFRIDGSLAQEDLVCERSDNADGPRVADPAGE